MAAFSGYLALGTLSDGVFTELSGAAGYARRAVSLDLDRGGEMRNAAAVTFPSNGGTAWPGFSSFAIYDAASSGNLLLAWDRYPGGRPTVLKDGALLLPAQTIELEFPYPRSSQGSEVVLARPYLWSPGGLRPVFVPLTQAAYDALAVKDPSTLYVING